MRSKVVIPFFMGVMLMAGAAQAAPAIYPVDTARFLGGSRFDFKVEFDKVIKPSEASVLINGKDASSVLGKSLEFVEREDGDRRFGHAAEGCFLEARQLRGNRQGFDRHVQRPGGTCTERPDKPVAKNVIVLIADGLSMGHRTSARLLSKGVTNGMYNGKLSMDTLPYMATLGTLQRGLHRRRLGQYGFRLHDGAQVQRQRSRRVCRPDQEFSG